MPVMKNEASVRLIPMHHVLANSGLPEYIAKLPKRGQLFPGLSRRASKGNKIGARLGELFRKKLVALGLKRDGLCFHSFRHTVAGPPRSGWGLAIGRRAGARSRRGW